MVKIEYYSFFENPALIFTIHRIHLTGEIFTVFCHRTLEERLLLILFNPYY